MDAALFSSAKMDWRTPELVLERVRQLGPIRLDPCTDADNPCGAAAFMTREGLEHSWAGHGLTYVNPPYGRAVAAWLAKCAAEAREGCEVVALVPARTDTRWWHRAYSTSQCVALWRGRLTFVGARFPAPFPSCLFYWGRRRGHFANAFMKLARVLPGGAIT